MPGDHHDVRQGRGRQGEAGVRRAEGRRCTAYPQYNVRDQTDYKQQLKDQIGQLLNMIYGLLGLAIIVAVLGVVNTLALSVVERTREIGLMRAIGISRRQLRRMIRLESVVIALFGALLGLGLGMGWGATAQQLLALRGAGRPGDPVADDHRRLHRLRVRRPVRRPAPGVPGGPDERPERHRHGLAPRRRTGPHGPAPRQRRGSSRCRAVRASRAVRRRSARTGAVLRGPTRGHPGGTRDRAAPGAVHSPRRTSARRRTLDAPGP